MKLEEYDLRAETPKEIYKMSTRENEVTMFGIDYDGAISAGEDGWNCNQCQCWNKEEDVFCIFCEG
jgi:hypothetical protein